MLATVLLVLCIFVIFAYKNHLKKYHDVDSLPGPSTVELLKQLYFNNSSKDFAFNLINLNKVYGPTVKLWMNPLKPAILTSDMKLCNKIFKCKDLHMTPCFREVKTIGDGFSITSDYEKWKQHKHLLTKHINKEYIAQRLIIHSEKYDKLINAIKLKLGKPFHIDEALNDIFMHTTLSSLNDPNVQLTEEEIQKYLKYKTAFFDVMLERLNSFYMSNGILYKFTNNFKLESDSAKNIIEFARNWLKRFKSVEEQSRERHNLVYAAINSGICDEDIVDFMNSIIQGSHDTGIYPASMLFCEMAEQPKLQQKILEEVWSTVGTDLTTPLTLADLDKMPYLQAAVKESVRRYTPLPFMDRELTYDMTVDNIKIPKGTKVIFNFPDILLSEENYDDPLTFKPERFLKENVTSKGQTAFIGFGYGAKSCPGKDLSYAALKLLVVKVIREFEIHPVPTHKIHLTADVVVKSTNGIVIEFRKRIQRK